MVHVVDVVGILSDAAVPRTYWAMLKRKLADEGASEVYAQVVQLKMRAPDGRMRSTDAANTETLLRIIQSVPESQSRALQAVVGPVRHRACAGKTPHRARASSA